MMEKLSDAASGVTVKVILGIVLLLFVATSFSSFMSFGASSKQDRQQYIAKVDGEGISRVAFENQIEQALEQGHSLSDKEALRPIVSKQILNSLLNEQLSFKLATDLNLQISDDLVIKTIKRQKVFFVDGAFNNENYLSLLEQNGYTPELYASLTRSNKQKTQLLDALLLTDFVLPDEDSVAASLVNQKRKGQYVNLDISQFVDESTIEVNDDEIKAFYDSNVKKYTHDEAVKVRYIVNSHSELAKNTDLPSNQESQIYYQLNIKNYTEPEKNEFAIIELKNKKEFSKVSNLIKKSKNKAKILGYKVTNLGWFERKSEPDYLASLDLKDKGDHKITTLNNKDYVVILTNTVKERIQPFEYVESNIRDYIYQNTVNDKYEEASNRLKLARLNFESLDAVAQNAGFKIIETSEWQSKKNPFSLAYNEIIKNALFNDVMINDGKATQGLTDVIELANDKEEYVLEVVDYRSAGTSELEQVKNEVKKDVINQKAKDLFETTLKNMVNDLNSDPNVVKFKTSFDVTRTTSTDFTKNELDMIFDLAPPKNNNMSYGYAFINNSKATIAALKEVKNSEDKKISGYLSNINKDQTYENFTNDLRSKAKIEIMDNPE